MHKILSLTSLLFFILFISCGSGGGSSDKGAAGPNGKSCVSFTGVKDQDIASAALLSLGIYEETDDVEGLLESVPNFNRIKAPYVSDDGSIAMIFYTPNGDSNHPVVLLVFRGTKTVDDSKTNFDFALQAYSCDRPDLMVHQGYLKKINKLLGSWTAELASVSTVPFYVMGHSQGGALAMIAAMKLIDEGQNVAKVFAFGAPKIGNQKFHNEVITRLGSKLEIITASADPAPSLPVSWDYVLSKGISFGSKAQLVNTLTNIFSLYPAEAMTATTVLSSPGLSKDQAILNCTQSFAKEVDSLSSKTFFAFTYSDLMFNLGSDIEFKRFDPGLCYPPKNHVLPYENLLIDKEACF